MTSCHTSHINFSHCITGGSWRPNFLFGKMLGSSLFHILWAARSSFSPCPYGIVVVVFHFDSGGRKAKAMGNFCVSGKCVCLAKDWRHSTLHPPQKIRIFQACVVSKLLYCLHTMWLNKAELRKIDGFQAKCLRSILHIPPPYIFFFHAPF